MLGLIAVSWGLVAGSMAAVNSSGGFLAVRFLLGVAEAGTVPGNQSNWWAGRVSRVATAV